MSQSTLCQPAHAIVGPSKELACLPRCLQAIHIPPDGKVQANMVFNSVEKERLMALARSGSKTSLDRRSNNASVDSLAAGYTL